MFCLQVTDPTENARGRNRGVRGAHWVQSCRTPGAIFPCGPLSLCTSLSHLSHVGPLTVKRQLPESKGPREGLWAVLFQPPGPLPIGHCCQWTAEEELSLGAQITVTCPPQSQRGVRAESEWRQLEAVIT